MARADDSGIIDSFLLAVENELTCREFSEQSAVSLSTVRKLEQRTGKKLKRVRSYPNGHGRRTDIDWPTALKNARERGLSVNKLAEELFVTTGSVLSAEDRTGIYLQRKHPNPRRVGGFRNASDNSI